MSLLLSDPKLRLGGRSIFWFMGRLGDRLKKEESPPFLVNQISMARRGIVFTACSGCEVSGRGDRGGIILGGLLDGERLKRCC